MIKKVIILCLISGIALAADIAKWQFSLNEPTPATYFDDDIYGLRAEVVSQNSGSSVFIDKCVCSGAIILPNSLSDSDINNVMLAVEDNDVLTGHSNGNGFDSLTIEVEFMADIIKQSVLVRKTQSNTAEGYQVFMNPDGKIGFQVNNGNSSGTATSRNSVEVGKWHRIIATWENQFAHYNTQVILDGVVSRSSTTVDTLTNTTYPLTIGGLYREQGNYGQFFSGKIRRVRISTDRPRLLDVHGKADPLEYIIPTGKHLENQAGFISSEFIYTYPKTPECHSATIVDLGGGEFGCAWFGGTCEGHIDVAIWYSRFDGQNWSVPASLAKGPMLFPQRDTIFNPALFKSANSEVMLFYGEGTLSGSVVGKKMVSSDNGFTFSSPMSLPVGIRGSHKNKPIQLDNGDIINPTSGNRVEISTNNGNSWTAYAIPNPNGYEGVIQPTILTFPNGKLQALFRTQETNIARSISFDYGRNWTNISLTTLPSNNSGIDAVTLADGRHLLVYNHSTTPEGKWGGARTPLNVAISTDGNNWNPALTLEDEDGEYSYPAIIQADDGLVHIVYTWKRLRVKHIVIDPQQL